MDPDFKKASASNNGNAPFSLANSTDAAYADLAKICSQRSVCTAASSEPYLKPTINKASAKPVTPSPILLLFFASSACSAKGNFDASTTLSIIRTAVATKLSSSASLIFAPFSKGFSTSFAKLIDPSRQAPYGGNGCSPHGFVAEIVSQ